MRKPIPATTAATILVTVLIGSTSQALAQEKPVVLQFEKSCTYRSKTFECTSVTAKAEIFYREGKWYGIKDELTPEVVPLQVVKDDANILILGNPVQFSGSSTVHLMKITRRVYWSEISYSEALNADGVNLQVGKFSGQVR